MEIESGIQHLHQVEGVLPQISIEGSLIGLLEADVLCEIESVLCQRGLHGVAFLSPQDDPAIVSLSTFHFSPDARHKKLGWHLDAFHIPESVGQRLTLLYSPRESHSTIPTFTTTTSLVDERTEASFHEFELPSEVVEFYGDRIEKLLGGKGRAFYTLLQNVSLADKVLNTKSDDRYFKIRDRFTLGILDDPQVTKGQFTTQAGVASLLFFRNGLGPNRDVAHTRFHMPGTPELSEGNVYNLSVEEGGIIHSKTTPQVNIPEGVRYQVGKFGAL